MISRLPEVRTLAEILPKGAEGGKEFARIVDFLLHYEARRAGKNLMIFNDAAGDYHGLDSFESDQFRKQEQIGYQYKFYPSPLSSQHRSEIKKCLEQVAEKQSELSLKKWILVTPQDLTESSTRKTGGDVSWFDNLHKKLKLTFEIEHWGHKKLQAQFIETPQLCRFYYPELISDGHIYQKSIQDIRKRYDDNLDTLYGKIEFVGMSVYKQEATKGVPMEHIYIPLVAVPEMADEHDENLAHTNPLSFLAPGSNNVVLGDPGAGKSTLLRFLLLVGSSASLQKRYEAKPDTRLPVLITLRRYADELKSRKNLSLIDYILENVQGDFSLKGADLNFFEYYLETGQTILLFDGLDELPSPQFKKDVRDRIRSLITTYPGNTVIVTSRIVGYDNFFRFDEKTFNHQRLTYLRLPEIEQFVKDWYRVRVDNKRDRDANANDLIRILSNEDHIAIRELAQNPLLLTIVALVHRIDAVLPDERVVLYQKCTETLLNTWHTWKYRESELKNKGRVERRNRRRMEAIAHWMHCRSGGTAGNQRAVVPYNDLMHFLTEHISSNEKIYDQDCDPQDLAEEFLEFIKKRAGLLIEIGDNQYSFVHLTFQEYLTASDIITNSEMRGVSDMWGTIKAHFVDDRWHEVIRLLIADLKSNASQAYLIDKLLEDKQSKHCVVRGRLLGGLLLDGVEPAEIRKKAIFVQLLEAAARATTTERMMPIVNMLKTCIDREDENEAIMAQAFQSLWKTAQTDDDKTVFELVGYMLGWADTNIIELVGEPLQQNSKDADILNLFCRVSCVVDEPKYLQLEIELLRAVLRDCSIKDPSTNFIAAALQAITWHEGREGVESFEQQLFLLNSRGPYSHYNFNSLLLSKNELASTRGGRQGQLSLESKMLKFLLKEGRDGSKLTLSIATPAIDRQKLIRASILHTLEKLGKRGDYDTFRASLFEQPMNIYTVQNKGFLQTFLSSPKLHDGVLNILCFVFGIKKPPQWREAMRVVFLPQIPKRINFINEDAWIKIENDFEKGVVQEDKTYSAASYLMLDIWIYSFGFNDTKNESAFARLADLTKNNDSPPLRIAHCIRDLAYGDGSRKDDLIAMLESEDPAYRTIFENCLWRESVVDDE
ncbi:MAG: NACHT domain-containing protein [Algicola sp.]|nr:NACHT domain-containing protein [Algicola sp.]